MQPTQPEPARFRLPIWLIVVAATAMLLLAVTGIWKLTVSAPFAARLASYRAAGEPVTAADLSSKRTLSADANAAEFLKRAQKAMKLTREMVAAFDKPNDSEFDEIRRQAVRDNPEGLELLHQACQAPEADWGLRLTSPLINNLFTHLSEARLLSRLAAVAAAERLSQGDSAGALAVIRDMVSLSRIVSAGVPGVIAHLVETAIAAQAMSVLENVGPCLDLTSEEAFQEAQALRADLLKMMDAVALDLERAFTTERTFLIDGLTSGALGSGALTPVLKLGGSTALDHATAIRDAARGVNYQQVLAAMPPATSSSLPGMEVAQILWPNVDRVTVLSFRVLAFAALSATALAMRMEEARTGRAVATLAELESHYGPAPQDVFAPGVRRVSLASFVPMRRLYSVGTDGVDQGGVFTFSANGDVDQDNLDLVYFMDEPRPARTIRAKTQPAREE